MPIILVIGAVVIAIGVEALFLVGNNPKENVDVRTEDATTQEISVTEENTEPEDEESEIDVNIEGEAGVNIENQSTSEPTSAITTETFSATASYLTPRRTEHNVSVTMSVANQIVTDVTVTFDGQPAGQYSNDNQARFDAAYSNEVVGKQLSDVSLSRVGGASLTSQAFNEAVAEISRNAS